MTAFGLGRLSPRDRRAILLGLAVLVPSIAWAGIVRPYRATLAGLRERVAAERALLAREQALIAAAGTLPDAVLAAEQEAARAEKRLVDAPSLAVAESDLTDHLERLAESSRVLLQEIRCIEPDRTDREPPGLRLIRLGINGESDLDGVTRLLHRLEEGQWLVNVRELQIEPVMERPRPARSRQEAAARTPQPTGVIQFSLVIEAYTPAEPRPRAAADPETIP